MAGYSKKSLADKLGIMPGKKLHLANAPDGYSRTLGALPSNITILKSPEAGCDFIQFFTKEKSELKAAFPRLKKSLATDGILWISWPKGASKIKTDVNENVVREIGLDCGLVDVKVCAVDEVWSGLKFVYRLRDR